jgi:catechol 2,3-dioxygenase-like lactoylglutathione lyase family enzyme
MSTIDAIYPVLMTSDVARLRDFYGRLLELDITFENDWYVSMARGQSVQLAFVEHSHDSIPDGFARPTATGVLVTVEVPDVDAVHARAADAGLPMHVPLRDEDWGQRHFITEDPDGVLVDVIALIPASDEYAASYVGFDAAP